jgi:hypothetical protein
VVPDAIGSYTRLRVRIKNPGTGVEAEIKSTTAFTVLGKITAITAPLSTDIWKVGETHTIKWTSVGTVDTVDIGYDTGIGWQDIVLADGGHGAGPNQAYI